MVKYMETMYTYNNWYINNTTRVRSKYVQRVNSLSMNG